MAIIILNGSQTETTAETLQVLAEEHVQDIQSVAIALNRQIIPRSLWVETPIKDQDTIEIVEAIVGG